MWECWNCGFQNVDASPVCSKCRARKPNEGEDPKGRSFHSMQQAAKERVADEVMANKFPLMPTMEKLREDWQEIAANPANIPAEMAKIEFRQYRIRESMRLLLNVVKNPQAKGIDEMMVNIYNMLLNWED